MNASQLNAARAAELEGDWPEAARLYGYLTNQQSDLGPLLTKLANALLNAGEYAEGLETLRRSLEYKPENAAWLSDVLLGTMSPAEAVEKYHQFVAATPRSFEADRYFSTNLMKAGHIPLVFSRFRHIVGHKCAGIVSSGRSRIDEGPSSLLINAGNGQYTVEMPNSFRGSFMHFSRFLSYTSYLDRLADDCVSGRARLCLSDSPDRDLPAMAMSAIGDQHGLIPDANFMLSEGYDAVRGMIAREDVEWADRHDLMYWRGSLTGRSKTIPGILNLPRVELCLLSRFKPHILDARIARGGWEQYLPDFPEIGAVLEGLGVVGDKEPESRNFHFKYLIDVDGNSNAWASYYVKLICGGVVVKLDSPYRQWYYHKTEPFQSFVPIKSITHDLGDVYNWLLENDMEASNIASMGRNLALSMSVSSEYCVFKRAFEKVSFT